ncbi:MAG: hypothetical protein ISN29_01900 [Gammaproteobacteria bacterium AqS3]|nr:hypothetical protein [Gammaproteobacteria bacterium AqS3]
MTRLLPWIFCGALISGALTASAMEAEMPSDAPTGDAERTQTFIGYACGAETGELAYIEVHNMTWAGERLLEDRLSYLRPDGRKFAEKKVDYRGSSTAPEFALVNSDSNHRESLEHGGEVMTVRFQGPEDDAGDSAELPPSDPPMIADAGFDRFIVEQWEELTSGRELVRPFLVPFRLDSLKMLIRRTTEPAAEPGIVAFEMVAKSRFLRLLAPTIRVFYATDSRRLRRFEGISNLFADGGGKLNITIHFPPDPPEPPEAPPNICTGG